MLRYKLDYNPCQEKKIKKRLQNYYTEHEGTIEKRFYAKALNEAEIDKVFNIIKIIEENYYSAMEYFASFLVMQTNGILNTIQQRNQVEIWNFISNAVFDEGINNLWSFYDEADSQHVYTFLFKQFYDIAGEKLSEYDFKDSPINELCLYRNHSSAHMGKLILDEDKARIHFSTPYRIIERIQSDLHDFWDEVLNIENFNSDEMDDIIHDKAISICSVLGIADEFAKIENEADELLKNLVKTDTKHSLKK